MARSTHPYIPRHCSLFINLEESITPAALHRAHYFSTVYHRGLQTPPQNQRTTSKFWAPDGRHEVSSKMKTYKNSSHRINLNCQGERLTRGLCTPVHLCPKGEKKKNMTLFWTFFLLVSYKELLRHFVHAQTDPRPNLPATAQVSPCYGRENKDCIVSMIATGNIRRKACPSA